ncbi:MAG: hypothetical protein DHS20C11_28610 [Lysobacteraceae bacterium]|nr:MAG: hypothetical protein DHS20C11_28610 [Xanthomonadaceae bacterium]
MNARSELLVTLTTLSDIESESPPTVPLGSYFEGNSEEQSIAPNQWGFGRPPISELYARFKQVEAHPQVQCVLVGLHFDWVEALEDDEVWPAAENIHIITSVAESEVASWITGLASDGLYPGWPYGEHPLSPKPKRGYQVYSVCWD